MNNKELVSYFNLSNTIDYDDLSKRLVSFLSSDNPDKVDTTIELINVVSELDWNLYQYRELLSNKTYSELYSSIISAYALNSKLGQVPKDLIQLDIKLRNIADTDEIMRVVNGTLIPLILNLLLKFTLDNQLLKLLNVIIVTREVCIKYHKKVKLTLDEDRFRRIRIHYPEEIKLFGFTKSFTENELKDRWRELAKKYHPDRNGGDGTMFIKCRDAYNNLKNLFD